ncbi:MAG: glycoside hydrolase family 38 C-terminal domain-containing protein [Planctomycetota bacterium]|jgi:alpha-mannosidase
MKFERLIPVLPCQSLEGYALDRETEHADELLSAWSALYHPELLVNAGSLPTWASAHNPPSDLSGSLIVLPKSSEQIIATGWTEDAVDSGAVVIRGLSRRNEIVEAALGQLDERRRPVDEELAADFLALGFCHMQVEILVRDAGYDMGNDIQYYDDQYYDYAGQFDRQAFQQETLSAAEAVVQGDAQKARQRLGDALTQLTEARRSLPYTYSSDTDPHLLDLTLVAASTLGQSLRDELARRVPVNVRASGKVIEQMAEREPATVSALQNALRENAAAMIGGEFEEPAVPLLTLETILAQFERGLDVYRRLLDREPEVFGRRRFGLSPVLPQVLQKLGLSKALHFTLDDGRFPASKRSRVSWVGIDGTEVDAVAQLPLDAARSGGFLNFAGKVSNASYQEHNATAVLAHWPGRACPWYRDLQRVTAYSPVLGQFRTVTEYLEQVQSTTERTRCDPDEYRSPYLKQAVAARQTDPVSRWVRFHRRRVAADAVQTLVSLAALVGNEVAEPSSAKDVPELGAITDAEADGDNLSDNHLENRLDEASRRIGDLVPREKGAAETAYLALNPWSFPRRIHAEVSALRRLPTVGGPVDAAHESAGKKQVVLDVPGTGFAWIGAGAEDNQAAEPAERSKGRWRWKKRRESPPIVEENILRNEHYEATINPTTGAVQGIDDYVTRGNRVAQQIAFRLPSPRGSRSDVWESDEEERDYSLMAADEISVTSSGPMVGEIVSRGRLVTRAGEEAARFVQTVRARQGSPVLELEIDLEVDREPGPNPWASYYAARFAWGDAAADVYRSVSLMSRPTDRPQIEAPHFVDVRSEDKRITILTGGLPYHRRIGLRKLDSLLVVRGETCRSFRLGIGVNLTHPVPAALDFLAPQHVRLEQSPPPPSRSGWLFHVDAKNVIATRWEPLISDGRVAGFRVRLLETEGRRGRIGLRSFRPVASARKVDFRGKEPIQLTVSGDGITLSLGAHEWTQVEAEFAG